MKWSTQQVSFLDWSVKGKGSCVLEAVAGAGKTTTILEAARRMAKVSKGEIAILAYNKKIAEEIKAKTAEDSAIKAGTVHSFGFGAYRRMFPKVKIDARKVESLAIQYLPEEMQAYQAAIVKMVSLAKQRCLGVIGSISNTAAWYDIIEHFDIMSDIDEMDESKIPVDLIIASAIIILNHSNKVTDVIDFDDMVYLPVYLKLSFWRYPVIFVDEAQDTNPARRALIRAMLKPNGRVIAVGDRAQAIYGFTGADANSLELIKDDFSAIEMPLTTTYRCPKAVVKFAQNWVNHIQSAPTSPEGSVSSIAYLDIFKRNDLNANSAILCRNTKPLVELAFQLIRNRIGCKVEGRDIGNGLKKTACRWKVKTTDKLIEKLTAWKESQVTKFLAKKQEMRAQSIEDQYETLLVIIEDVNLKGKHNVTDVVAAIDSLFADDVKGVLILSTIHKSKGREWETVYWLDRAGTCPSRHARQAWQIEQENNLCYVAATRAKNSLIELVKSK